MAKKKKNSYWVGLIFAIAVGIASWSFYKLLNMGVRDLLLLVGVQNEYLQNISVIGLSLIILILSGLGVKKSLDKLLK